MIREFLGRCLLLVMACGHCHALSAAAEPQTPPAQPNIVFVIADDLGIGDLGCYGRQDQPTVNLDRLAREGMRFTSAYAAQSVCSPTRAAIMTGKTPARLHLTNYLPGRPDSPAQLLLQPTIEQQLPLAEKTIAECLQEAGYATACIGKWHLGGPGFLPTNQGFDLYEPGAANTQPSASEGGKGEYDLTAKAEAFLEANRARPFLLYVAHNCPHEPLAAKSELIEKHRDAFHPVYAAMIETLDDCVGRLTRKIDSLGLTDRTCIVFTSDNGGLHVLETAPAPATHNTPYRAGKGFLYEGGLRVSLIVRWPTVVPPGKTVDASVISTDWFPTLLTIAGVPAPKDSDGVSFAELLTAGRAPAARRLYWHQPHYTNQGGRPSGAVQDGKWKLIEHYEDGHCELFDLALDTAETTDVSAEFPARVAQLRGYLEAWRREVGAQSNAANVDFNAAAWSRIYQGFDPSTVRPAATALAMTPKFVEWRRSLDAAVPQPDRGLTAAVPAGPGAVLLHAHNATVHGEKLRYEPEAAKDTLGYWTKQTDFAEWRFELPKAGSFDVEVLYGCGAKSGGAEVEVSVADEVVTMKVEETGHFQRFVPRHLGTIRLAHTGPQLLTVRAKSKPGGAVMDLRRVTLRAAGEQ